MLICTMAKSMVITQPLSGKMTCLVEKGNAPKFVKFEKFEAEIVKQCF